MIRLKLKLIILVLTAFFTFLVVPAVAQAGFGIEPGSLKFGFEDSKGQPVTQAGSHPYGFNLRFKLNTIANGQTEGGELRDIRTDLPPGLIGNPQVVPVCPRQSFEGALPICPPGTQVGVLRVLLPTPINTEAFGPAYNLTAPPGTAALLGFTAAGFTALLSVTVDPSNGYAVHVEVPNIPLEASAGESIVWGTPADPRHDPERGPSGGLESDAAELPFMTMPTSCTVPSARVAVSSKQAPETFVQEMAQLLNPAGQPQALTGCEVVPFTPSTRSATSASVAESPSGFGFQLGLPNQGLTSPQEGAITETEPLKTEVALPPGITANPAAVAGQGVCSEGQFNSASATNLGCPPSSKLGTLLASSPLLEEPIEGSVFLAAPHANPFNSLLALYIVAQAPARGVVVKQAGLVTPNPFTGQLTTTFDGLPPIPYSSFEVRLREGARAPLITPQLCGTYNTTARLYSYANPGAVIEKTAPFTIATGAGGAPCAASEAALPNHPAFSAGTTSPIAGAYSPFVLNLSRQDGEQRFSSLDTTLPEGLVGRLAGIPYCPEAQIAAATARSGEGQGILEATAPSCPAASQIGTVTAGAGAGPTPYEVGGSAYLAGPYKGAPLSVVIITPAIAGPFDLGTVVVRAGLYVNETTAKVTVKSDPLPTILHGLPLDVRSVSVAMNRESFILNPTSCEAKQISAQVTSQAGQVANLQNRFKVGSCKGLDFSPSLSMKLSGATTRAKHPAFKAVLTQPKGQANLAKISLTLPPTEFVDPNHVANPCTRPQFAANNCPSSSVLGKVRAFTPLLDKPLEGPIYFRANGGERELPDAVADLNGQVHLVSVGFVDALHHKGSEESRIRTTIATIPDAPISKVVIELKGGKKHGLLVNSANICKTANRAIVKMAAQNGKTLESEPRIATSCKK